MKCASKYRGYTHRFCHLSSSASLNAHRLSRNYLPLYSAVLRAQMFKECVLNIRAMNAECKNTHRIQNQQIF